jgi:3-hydroxyacyl-[acyl-carrier-protein] dehydratase
MSDNRQFPAWLRAVIDRRVMDLARGTVTAELCCPADFPAFAGHFPGQPVLPAVLQLLVVRMLAGDLLQMPLEPVATGKMKFKGMIGPGERVVIEVSLARLAELWQGVFKLRKAGTTVVSSGTVLYQARRI